MAGVFPKELHPLGRGIFSLYLHPRAFCSQDPQEKLAQAKDGGKIRAQLSSRDVTEPGSPEPSHEWELPLAG